MTKKLFNIIILLSLIKIANAQQGGELRADFDYSPKIITTSDLTITFTDKSTGSMTYWYWDFGDGTIVTTQNPIHKYAKSGIYQVALTVGDNDGNINTTTIAIDARTFIPDFTYSSSSGNFLVNEEIQFSDKTNNTPEIRLWDFGDGTTSTEQNPKHIFAKAATYTITLTITKSNITRTINKALKIFPSSLKFSGHIIDQTSKKPLKNMTVSLYDGNVNESSAKKLLSLVTDDNGDYSSILDWNGKNNLTVLVYDNKYDIYIPAINTYTGYRDELTINGNLCTKSEFFCIRLVSIKGEGTPATGKGVFSYNAITSWLSNQYYPLYDLNFYVHPGGYNLDFYTTHPYRDGELNVSKILYFGNEQNVDLVGNVYMEINLPSLPDFTYALHSKLCIVKHRESNDVVPQFHFVENSDFIMLGDIVKILDTSDPFDKISKIDINWGDGNISTYQKGTTYPTSRLFEHIYNAIGEYIVSLKTYEAGGWNASTSAKCKVISCSSGPFEYMYAYSKLIIASDNINKVNFNYDDMLSLKYPGEYKPVSECIMEACNQIKIGPNSSLSQTLGVPLILRIITPGSSLKSANANNDNFSGIQEETNTHNTENEGVFIYPNPASRFFTIKATGKSILKSYELFNNIGNCVKKENCNRNESQVDISSLAPGVYVVKVVTEDKLFNSKLIIE